MTTTLLDLSSRVVAQLYPFQLIEERYKIIPEPVQRKIIFHAFPRQLKEILIYSNYFNDEEKEWRGEVWEVGEVLQVGFLLSGRVVGGGGGSGEDVRIHFDRCKITSISCTCTSSTTPPHPPTTPSKKTTPPLDKLIFWCDHVVALAIFRIQHPHKIELRVPISETLATLTRPQLQKLVQYLLHAHPSVLPSTQNLADKLLSNKNEINSIHGAPDITAGASIADENSWAFNEQNMAELIKDNVYDEGRLEGVVGGLFKKIHTMTHNSDTNAPRILTLLTTTILENKPPHRTTLWDQILTLWQITVMSPTKTIPQRDHLYTKLLTSFNTSPNIPLDENHAPLLKKCVSLLKTDYTKKTSDLKLNTLRLQSLNCYHGYEKETRNLALKIYKITKKLENYELDYDLAKVVYNVLQKEDSNLAGEFGLLTLGQNRGIPNSLYLQEKWLKNEESFILNIKTPSASVIEKFLAVFLAKTYNSSTLPLYNFAKFLYKSSPTSQCFKLAIKYLKQTPPTTFITTQLENQQVNLTLLLINTAKLQKPSLDVILTTLSTHIKSTSCLFRIAQESSRLEETNANLLNFSFNLGLHVLKSTLKFNHRKRWDIVRWVMNSSLTCGWVQVLYLLTNWVDYFTPNEAVGTLAREFLTRGTSLRLGLSFSQQQSLGEAARQVGLGGMRVDPGNCSLNALTICESDPVSFETAYQIILEAAKQQNLLNCQQIFTIARYMEHRGYPLRAYKLAAIAIGHLHIPFNQETHSSITDIHWTCTLAQSLGDSELSNLLPVIISNIKCASVLSEILKRAAMEPPRKCHRNTNSTCKIYARLKLLVEATINSYVTTIHNRLAHISPRHYADFIEYLGKAKECFLFAPEGLGQFRNVVMGIKREYKGKKKLVVLVGERFG